MGTISSMIEDDGKAEHVGKLQLVHMGTLEDRTIRWARKVSHLLAVVRSTASAFKSVH